MKRALLTVIFVGVFSLAVRSQHPVQSERDARKTYPDFALEASPINTSPGPEYVTRTRVYQGMPGIERSANGRLWALWNAAGTGDSFGEGPFDYVVLVTRGDEGKTWSEPKLVIDPPGNVHAWGGCLWVDPRGRLWLFWSQDYGEWDGRGGVWAIGSSNPDSENPKWSKPRRIANGEVQNKLTVLKTGEWLLPVAVWPWECNLPEANERFRLGLSPSAIKALCHDLGEEKGLNVYVSADQGKIWKLLGQVHGADKDQPLEHMIVERHDGSLWMLVRTSYGIGQAFSKDRGKIWEQISPSGIPHPRARFFIRRLNSGRLLMVRHNPPAVEYPENCDHCGQMNRSHLTAYLSDDDGGSWYGGLLLDEREKVSYPDGVEADNGKIYVIYDRGRNTDREILMATFTEEDVRQGKCATRQCQLKMLVNKAGE
ncbi:MAG: sialidase family protein [Terriglobales bacterium]